MNTKKEILEILAENDRITPAEIAAMLGVDEEEVRAQIEELEKKRIILKYRAVVNWEKTDVEAVAALIDVKVTPQRDVGFDDVARRIYRYPEVKSVFLVSGAYDLSVLVEARTLKELAFFVAEKLATLENVTSTATHFVLKRYKQDGVIFDEGETAERLAISP
ncbi:MAG: Lrp/AsnC family transcriptional regulator [Firmicutes bacterium]|nr:Lrp/AsnC family transcriptional regulator [Bacillota bacterium]